MGIRQSRPFVVEAQERAAKTEAEAQELDPGNLAPNVVHASGVPVTTAHIQIDKAMRACQDVWSGPKIDRSLQKTWQLVQMVHGPHIEPLYSRIVKDAGYKDLDLIYILVWVNDATEPTRLHARAREWLTMKLPDYRGTIALAENFFTRMGRLGKADCSKERQSFYSTYGKAGQRIHQILEDIMELDSIARQNVFQQNPRAKNTYGGLLWDWEVYGKTLAQICRTAYQDGAAIYVQLAGDDSFLTPKWITYCDQEAKRHKELEKAIAQSLVGNACFVQPEMQPRPTVFNEAHPTMFSVRKGTERRQAEIQEEAGGHEMPEPVVHGAGSNPQWPPCTTPVRPEVARQVAEAVMKDVLSKFCDEEPSPAGGPGEQQAGQGKQGAAGSTVGGSAKPALSGVQQGLNLVNALYHTSFQGAPDVLQSAPNRVSGPGSVARFMSEFSNEPEDGAATSRAGPSRRGDMRSMRRPWSPGKAGYDIELGHRTCLRCKMPVVCL